MLSAAASAIDPATLVRPRRAIRGMSAILLPFTADRQIDWDAFAGHVARTAACGITPAISMDTGYVQLIQIPNCIGAKHSWLSRQLEWERLVVRNRVRPEFHVFTGNDLAIDMVGYGSDWLLGLSTAYPEAFAQRDRWWGGGDNRFDELDDALQALGDFAFRPPVPAYKQTMAMALQQRGTLASDEPHPDSPRRPASDREIVTTILARIDAALHM